MQEAQNQEDLADSLAALEAVDPASAADQAEELAAQLAERLDAAEAG
ncbi:MAG: hypothetical protein ACE5MI_05225 [Acidimicrobiia bacterium]